MPELKPLPCPHCGFVESEEGYLAISYRLGTQMICPKCGVYGPIGEDYEDAKKQWNALPRAFRFTPDPPKVAGWYWYSMGKGHTVCLLVCACGTTLKAKLGKDHFTDVELLGGEWTGPIPAPVEG